MQEINGYHNDLLRRPCISTYTINNSGSTANLFDDAFADIIGTTLAQGASGSNVEVDALRARVKKLTDKHPLYAGLEQ